MQEGELGVAWGVRQWLGKQECGAGASEGPRARRFRPWLRGGASHSRKASHENQGRFLAFKICRAAAIAFGCFGVVGKASPFEGGAHGGMPLHARGARLQIPGGVHVSARLFSARPT